MFILNKFLFLNLLGININNVPVLDVKRKITHKLLEIDLFQPNHI